MKEGKGHYIVGKKRKSGNKYLLNIYLVPGITLYDLNIQGFSIELNNLKFNPASGQTRKYFSGALKYYMEVTVVVTMTLICDGVLGELK